MGEITLDNCLNTGTQIKYGMWPVIDKRGNKRGKTVPNKFVKLLSNENKNHLDKQRYLSLVCP